MSEGTAQTGSEISPEVILEKAKDIIIKLRDLERRVETEDPKKVYQELKQIVSEARQYALDKSIVPLVRKIKAAIMRRYQKLAKEKLKASQKT